MIQHLYLRFERAQTAVRTELKLPQAVDRRCRCHIALRDGVGRGLCGGVPGQAETFASPEHRCSCCPREHEETDASAICAGHRRRRWREGFELSTCV